MKNPACGLAVLNRTPLSNVFKSILWEVGMTDVVPPEPSESATSD